MAPFREVQPAMSKAEAGGLGHLFADALLSQRWRGVYWWAPEGLARRISAAGGSLSPCSWARRPVAAPAGALP